MYSKHSWKDIYNNVFKLFPPPDSLIKKITVKINKNLFTFKNSKEMLLFITVNNIDNIDENDIEFYIKGDKLELEINETIEHINQRLKNPSN